MATMNRIVYNITDPLVAEHAVVIYGLQFAMDIGFHTFIDEGDSLLTIRALQSNEQDFSWLGYWIDVTCRLLQYLQYWEQSHVKKEANSVAHLLARSSKNVVEPVICSEDAPSFFHTQLKLDVMS